MKKDSKNKPHVFTNPINWYIAGVLIRFESVNEDQENLNRRCLAWENQHLIKAKNPDEAYKKALKIGKESEDEYINTDGENVRWIFEGLTTLIALYEDLEDGAEIIWIEYEDKAVKTIRRKVKSKENLEVFERNKENYADTKKLRRI